MQTLTHSVAANSSTIRRTLVLWVLSNLGGTTWLLLDFCRERLADYSIALFIGLLAALVSLFIVPLVVPFFSLMCGCCSGWLRRTMACLGVVLFFGLANVLLMLGLPIDSFSSLLSMSLPYLVAALGTVFWLYGPGQEVGKSPFRQPVAIAQYLASLCVSASSYSSLKTSRGFR